MITITEKAAEKAKAILIAEGKEGWGLRIFNAGGECCGPSFGLDIDEKATEHDDTLESFGLKVFVDKSLAPNIDGLKLDYFEDGQQEGFVLAGAESTCGSGGCGGCGSSGSCG
ncbi:MAG: iron-sulfur cluster assembly accessory protein [Dissulfurispiraceae bacterium]|nr:iron-sulfur cluster assembly accessory protein [Dissulfurispiraceae bacterium]